MLAFNGKENKTSAAAKEKKKISNNLHKVSTT
jgi:hypothetical protein